jgi:3-methyladenine DNA glycosylase Tag
LRTGTIRGVVEGDFDWVMGGIVGCDAISRRKTGWRFKINNGRRMRDLVKEFGLTDVGTSAEALAMSRDLRKRGWAFVGPTTVYSFIEAMGLVNDHVRGCTAGAEVERARFIARSRKRPVLPPAA